jgi:hypothetical protein
MYGMWKLFRDYDSQGIKLKDLDFQFQEIEFAVPED